MEVDGISYTVDNRYLDILGTLQNMSRIQSVSKVV